MVEVEFGLALIVVGYGIRLWALIQLRRAGLKDIDIYQTAKPPGGFVKTGPYRFVAHPAYWGSILILTGAGIAALGWGGAVLCLPSVPYFVQRARLETFYNSL